VKIIVDCRYTRLDHHDGVSRYTARIVEALARRHPVTMLINDERQLALLPDLPWHRVSGPTNWREPWLARQVNQLEPDVVFSPLQTMGGSGRRYGLVLTLHDLIYYSHRTPPRDLPAPVRLLWRLYHLAWWPQRRLLNRADEVVTVSETTRDLIAQHRLTERPVNVVRNAADAPGTVIDREPPTTRELVYISSFMPYKNVETLARSMRHLPGYRLHLMSRVPPGERSRLSALAPDGSLEFHDGASDEEYFALLDRATALVHASLDEGFGIPLVEAMGRGTPVVVSDIPIFREIGGAAAEYVPPGDDEAFARAVRGLEVADTWRKRSAAARKQAALFDWDRSVEVLFEVLQRVARKERPLR
jgi:glycosyltransferase involved in cell wall biosynthesis